MLEFIGAISVFVYVVGVAGYRKSNVVWKYALSWPYIKIKQAIKDYRYK